MRCIVLFLLGTVVIPNLSYGEPNRLQEESLCESPLRQDQAKTFRGFPEFIRFEEPSRFPSHLSDLGLLRLGMNRQMKGTNWRARIRWLVNQKYFEIVGSEAEVIFQARLPDSPVYVNRRSSDRKFSHFYVILAEQQGVRIALSTDDYANGAFYELFLDVPCEDLDKYVNEPLDPAIDPIYRIEKTPLCRVPLFHLHEIPEFDRPSPGRHGK